MDESTGHRAQDETVGEQHSGVVVVLDHQLPDGQGLDVARTVLARDPTQPIVLFTAYLTEDLRHDARRIGIQASLTKTRLHTLPAVVELLMSGPYDLTQGAGAQADPQPRPV